MYSIARIQKRAIQTAEKLIENSGSDAANVANLTSAQRLAIGFLIDRLTFLTVAPNAVGFEHRATFYNSFYNSRK